MRPIYPILIALLANIALQASNPIKLDTIVVNRTDDNSLVYQHKLQSKSQLYQLAKLLDISKEELIKINNDAKDNDEVMVPLQMKNVITSKSQMAKDEDYLPVVYIVQAKDNLFRISRHYFFQALDELMTRNSLKDYNLSIGQHIHVGWLNVSLKDKAKIEVEEVQIAKFEAVVKDTILTVSDTSAIQSDIDIVKKDSSESIKVELINYSSSQGKGMWKKSMHDNGKLFVLHRTAKINSLIEVKNPMLNRSVHAKVAGRIPENLYPDDIEVFISPSTAKALGILDSNFFVELRYTK